MNAPAFQFYPADFISSTIAMSQEEVGAYIRLLCYQWCRGIVPACAEKQYRIAGGIVSPEVLAKFESDGSSGIKNKRLELERQKQKAFKELQSAKAIKRWAKPDAERMPETCTGNAAASTGHMPEACSSSSSSVRTEEVHPQCTGNAAAYAGQMPRHNPQIVLDTWNANAVTAQLPTCLVLSQKRKRHVDARLKDEFFRDHWKEALPKMNSSPFCIGQNERGWKASFDWFIRPDTVASIMEGKYDARQRTLVQQPFRNQI